MRFDTEIPTYFEYFMHINEVIDFSDILKFLSTPNYESEFFSIEYDYYAISSFGVWPDEYMFASFYVSLDA